MNKIWILLFTTIFLFPIFSGHLLRGDNPGNQGEEEFINFLVKNKDTLNYESFGTFEHENWIEVRVYCTEDARKKIEENIAEFNYKEYKYKNSGSGIGTLFVVFVKDSTSGIAASGKQEIIKKKKCPRKVFVKYEKIEKKSFNEYKYFEEGLIDGGVSILYSEISGKVAKVFLNPGDKVDEGGVVLNFDVSEADKKINEIEASLNDWRTTLRKRRQWKVRSERAELQAENMVNDLKVRLDEKKALQKKNVLVSDKSGQLISIVASGTILSANDEVAKILDNSVLKMVFSGDDAVLLSALDSLSVKFTGIEEIKVGKVEKADGKVIVSFDNSDLKLSSKSIGKFKVLVKAYDAAVVLKESGLKKDEAGSFVYIIQKKRAKKVYVRRGPVEDGKILLISGLNEGDDLILTDDECIVDGKKIKFTPPAVKVKKVSKKAEKKIVKPVRKIVAREEKPVETNVVRFVKKRDWSEFDNCPSSVKVKTKIVRKGNFYGYETFDSFISSGSIEVIKSDTDGFISDVNVTTGTRVSRGQLIVSIDNEDLMKRLESTRTSLEEWKKLLSELEGWTERSVNLENELKQKIRKKSLLIPKLSNTITNSKIYSPVDGIVSFIIKQGESFKEGDVLVKIEDDSRVRIPVNVDDISKYDESMKVEAGFKDIEKIFPAKLKKSDGRIVVIVDNYSKSLSIGMKAKVNILRDYKDVIVLYKSEFLRDKDGYFAYIADNKRAKRVNLTTGAEKGSKMLILSGLKVGDELITSGFDCIEDGKKIRIKYFDAETGKYVIKRTDKERKDLSRRLLKKKMSVGLGIGYYMVSDEIFTTVYGSGVISGVFDLSFNVFNRVELFTNIMYIPKAGSSESITKVDLSMFSFYIGGKYLIKWTGKFLPYLGVAFNSVAVKESSEELELDTSYRTAIGFSGIGGFYYKLKENINLKFDLRYDVIKMKVEEFDSELDFSGIKFVLGIVLRF